MFENHAPPQMPVQAYKTYGILAPSATHRRKATCSEVDCPQWANGWRMGFDVSDASKAAAVNWLRLHSGRTFTTEQIGDKVTLTFPAGQTCFATHTLPLEREPLYIVRGGDWRAVTSSPVKFNADDWVDDFANHQDKLAQRLEQG